MKRLICFIFPIFFINGLAIAQKRDWRTASRESANIAPKASEIHEAIVQIYGARAYSWRGWFAVHCWISYKFPDEKEYKVAQVIGWRLWRHDSALSWEENLPDRYWFGERPELLSQLRGDVAARAIPKIEAAIESYPHKKTYRAWPGPNSNSFIAHIIREVPELTVELPPHAIGKDWLKNGRIADMAQSGKGVQLSLLGLAGITIGLAEGLEINILGLSFGIDLLRPALKLPLVGRLGMKDKSVD